MSTVKRRDFLKSMTASVAAIASGQDLLKAESQPMTPTTLPTSNAARLPRRRYGKTEIELSVIGLGGMLLSGMEQSEADRVVAEFVERGGNYFDVAPTYGDSEHKLGPALRPYRKNVFLACKTTQRLREGAGAELKESLRRLRTDHLDLYQLHALTGVQKDVDTVFSKGGAMEILVPAKKAGQIRHLGFSAHSVEAAQAAMERYAFDSILFPINAAACLNGDFGPQIVKLAGSKGVALLALKAMARQVWPKDDPEKKKYSKCWYQPFTDPHEAELGIRFTLSQPVTAAIPPGEPPLFRLALDVASSFKPLDAQEQAELKTLVADVTPIFKST
jgi:aryl-alcohol dehydrogenase-like predicted oxidoreductase